MDTHANPERRAAVTCVEKDGAKGLINHLAATGVAHALGSMAMGVRSLPWFHSQTSVAQSQESTQKAGVLRGEP